VLIAAERHGSVRSVPVENDSIAELKPVVNAFVSLEAYLMSDDHRAYGNIAQDYKGHVAT